MKHSYIRARHGICRAAADTLQHTVSVAGFYLPRKHVVYTTWLLGDLDLERVIEKCCERSIDYTQFTLPSMGKVNFRRDEHPQLPADAVPCVFEISKKLLVANMHGGELQIKNIEITMKSLFTDEQGRQCVNTRELPLTAVPAFIGLDNLAAELNKFCNNNIFVQAAKVGKEQSTSSKPEEQIKYPAPPTKIVCGEHTMYLHVWIDKATRKQLMCELAQAKIFTGLIADIPVLDLPLPITNGRLPVNLEFAINRKLRKHGHAYSYNEYTEKYEIVRREAMTNNTMRNRKAFAAYSSNESKFLQGKSRGYHGAIWD